MSRTWLPSILKQLGHLLAFGCFAIPGFVLEGAEAPFDSIPQNAMYGGLVLSVEENGEQLPVLGFREDQYLIRREGEIVGVGVEANLQVQARPKFANRYIQITDLNVTPRKSQQEDYLNTIRAIEREIVRQEQILDMYRARGLGSFGALPPGTTVPSGQSTDDIIFQTEDRINELRDQINDMDDQLMNRDELVDSLFIRFDLFSETPVEDPFFVVVATFTKPSDGDDTPYLNIFTKGLNDIEPGVSERIRFQMGGFPENFNVVRMGYHLFSGREEIPNSLTEEIMAMTDEEAYEYLYGQYVANFEGPDRRPQLFKPLLRHKFVEVISENSLEAIRLKLAITAKGETSVESISGAESDELVLLREMLAELRFLPAMEDGIPVDRSVNVSLTRVLR